MVLRGRYCHKFATARAEGTAGLLMFELSWERRYGAWPAKRMMNHTASRAKRHAGASRLERRVGRHE
jgi:hypothetical protein